MAKELPYFKFEPNQWENGNIQICNREDKGLFIDLCSMYWSRLGDLPIKLAIQKLCNGNATAYDSLIQESIFKVIDGQICIDFLNEQLIGFESLSSTNSENARLGWEKRKKNATALQPQSESDAIREDKNKEDNKRKETINYDRVFDFFKKTTGKQIKVFSHKAKGQLNQRLKDGFTYEDIESAILNCKNNEWHNKPENKHYLTLEFILRSESIEKYKSAITMQSERKLLRLPQEYENYMGMELGLLLSRIKLQRGIEYIPDITKEQYNSLPMDSFNMYDSLIKSNNCKLIEE